MAIQYSDEVIDALEKVTNLLHDHARSIGELCMSWAAMDNAIDDLLEPLLDCDRATIACLATSMEKTEARISTIKRLMVLSDISPDWRNWADMILNRITVELGP